MLKNGQDTCTCKKKSCPRFGKCEECVAYHRENKKYEPYCMRRKKPTLIERLRGAQK